jgi:CheY-like chemotaxis protein
MTAIRRTILLAEDDQFFGSDCKALLVDLGHQVLVARSVTEAKHIMEANAASISLALIDVRMPYGDGRAPAPTEADSTKGGFESGLVLGRWIRDKYPRIPVLGIAAFAESEVQQWFEEHGKGFRTKSNLFADRAGFAAWLESATGQRALLPRNPRVFIVHGHDDLTKLQLKNYVQNRLHLGQPIILHEQPSFGRTILEKFEEEARGVNLVFVLLTPDDGVFRTGVADEGVRRARQNVIFELGYFLGMLGRRKGRVLLLYKGALDLPSDISGLVYIDITGGIDSAGEEIRKELGDLIDA